MGKQTATFELYGVRSGVAQRIILEGSANTIRTDARRSVPAAVKSSPGPIA
jgi:hypothetical protein